MINSAVQHLTMLLIGYHDIYSSIKLVNYCWVLPLIGRRDIYSPIQLVSYGIRLVSILWMGRVAASPSLWL